MRLESVRIEGYRSVKKGELVDCGGFNVLIGKNNAGKSNLLSSINSFFECIRNGSVVNLDPPIGQKIDFFEKKIGMPIKITMVFSMSLSERDGLLRDIVTEAPQVKNVTESLDPSLRLHATVQVSPPPRSYSYVSRLALGERMELSPDRARQERVILSVGDDAASGLRDQLHDTRQRQDDSENLRAVVNRIDASDWQMLSGRERDRGGPPLRYFLRGLASGQPMSLVESTLRKSESYDEFVREIQDAAAKMRDEALAIRDQPLGNKISTFSGEESSIPTYVTNLLRRISDVSVLHLTDRRKPIGKEEAERLLSLKVRRGGPKILRTIQDTVSALLGVQIDAFESGSSERGGETAAEMDVDNFLVEVNGSGIREALRLVLDVEFHDPQILLVEEPEIHLHPALETSVMRYLKRISSDRQVFISTHSTNFLDTPEMRNVYLVSNPDSTEIQLLDLEEAEARIPKELGLRLSALFMYDRLVLVILLGTDRSDNARSRPDPWCLRTS